MSVRPDGDPVQRQPRYTLFRPPLERFLVRQRVSAARLVSSSVVSALTILEAYPDRRSTRNRTWESPTRSLLQTIGLARIHDLMRTLRGG